LDSAHGKVGGAKKLRGSLGGWAQKAAFFLTHYEQRPQKNGRRQLGDAKTLR